MSDTPKADAMEHSFATVADWFDFARQLERENAALRKLLNESLDWLDDYGLRLSGSAKLAENIKAVLKKETQS